MYILEPINVPQHFHNCRGTETVPSYNRLIDMEAILPVCPVDTFQTSRAAPNMAFTSQILSLDFFPIPRSYHPENPIRFFQLAKAHLNLSVTQFSIDTLLVVWQCVLGVVLREDVVLPVLETFRSYYKATMLRTT